MRQQATLTQMFETACRRVGDRPFLIDDVAALSGTDTATAARQAAVRLGKAGLRPGGVTAFLCGPSTDHAVAFFAAARAGGIGCALHARDSDTRLAATLDEVRPQLVVADEAELERAAGIVAAAGLAARVVALGEIARLSAGDPESEAHAAAADDLAAIILSSGTTGRPKQVLHTNRSLLATAAMAGPIYGVRDGGDSIVVPMAPSFAAWIHTVLPFVAAGCTIVFQRRYDTAGYVELVERHAVTIAALVPTLWRMVLPAMAGRDLPRLRVGMFSGEPGTADLVAALRARVSGVRGVYLASEGGCACGVVADEAVLSLDGMAGCAGRPVPGGQMRVIDPDADELRPLPPGATGEIALAGPSLSAGYLGQPELTARRFLDGWWRTGDHGFVDPQGVLHLRGRLDNRINTGGIKVHAEEIEAALMQLDIVRQAAVVGVPDPQWGQRIEAHVTLAAGTADDVAAAFEAATSLPRSLRPKRYHVHASLPVGPTGKLYRRGLLEGHDA